MVMTVELAPVSAVAEKFRVRSPAVPLMDKLAKLATPVPVVVAVSVPPNVPLPVAIAAVTTTPAWLTGFPAPSRNRKSGWWGKRAALGARGDVTEVTVSWVAAPAVIVMAVDVTLVSPVAEKLSVRSPAVPLIARLVKDATPLPVVVAVSVPPNVPPPVAITAVTTTPAWLTGFPAPSPSCTTGCWAKATPLGADAEGSVGTGGCGRGAAVLGGAVELKN